MAGSCTEEAGVGRSLDCVSNGQQECQSLAEWRSAEQVENGTPSTSPPYWDIDDDDFGPKPSELYGKYTWKIDKFSQINKRELRSNAFEVGSYKWYILVYPQGCDVCNHLSLFLCVANHDKLLPGWSHFAQFTIAVVNKDPKKSKYSDTLHRFWKKEHDWGWKKFMELLKVLDGFIDSDTLIIQAQVQVIRERVDRPFSCLDCQYRRELVRVYLSNVEQICRRFVEERRGKLGKLIEDKARWTSFCAFWSGMNPAVKFLMTREKTESILRVVVKHFFIEKEVTSTLVMDSLFSGLKALEGQTKSKNDKRKLDLAEEVLAPVVCMEKDMFVLVDDVLLLLERVATEPLPPKDDKGPQNRTKDGSPGEDFNKESIERDERRLTELGRRTIETFVVSHIFSSKIEVAYQDAVSLKRQEELIREEEAEWMVASEQKSKRGAAEKEKKSKKKQGKQKRNNRKIKDKGKSEKSSWTVQDNIEPESPISEREEYFTEEAVAVSTKPGALEDASDLSDSLDCVSVILQPESEERDASPVSAWKQVPGNTDPDSTRLKKDTESAQPMNSSEASMPLKPLEKHSAPQKPETPQLLVMPNPTAPIVSMVHSTPLLARSVSAAGRVGPEPSSTSQSYIPQSYRNAIMGNHGAAQAPAFARRNQDLFGNGSQWTDNYTSNSGRILSSDRASVLGEIRNFDVYNPIHLRSPNNPPSEPSPCTSGPQCHSAMADEFPHLDIINDLLDDDLGIEIGTSTSSSFESFSNRPQHLNRQFSFPSDIPMSSCRFERTQSYQEDGYWHDYIYPGGPWESFREMLHHSNSGPGSHPDQWHMASSNNQSFVDSRDLENASYAYHIPDYSNLACGINGYGVFRPSSGF